MIAEIIKFYTDTFQNGSILEILIEVLLGIVFIVFLYTCVIRVVFLLIIDTIQSAIADRKYKREKEEYLKRQEQKHAETLRIIQEEKENERLAYEEKARRYENEKLTEERRQQLFCPDYGLCLVHFTKVENLLSILAQGLVVRSKLQIIGHEEAINDPFRLDGYDATCLSLSFPNYRMFWKYRKNSKSDWIVLILDYEKITKMDVAYCYRNAASNEIRNLSLQYLKSQEAKEKMFAPKIGNVCRECLKIPSYYTTDPQAEILCFDTIPRECIQAVVFEDYKTYSQYRYLVPNGIEAKIDDNYYFTWRKDFEHWKK